MILQKKENKEKKRERERTRSKCSLLAPKGSTSLPDPLFSILVKGTSINLIA